MAEIYVKDGETKEEVARRLLDQAAHPDHVVWQPRSGQEAGGVFFVPDDEVDDLIARVEAARRAETEATEKRIAFAEERDARIADTGLTPEQAGFPANFDAAAVDEDDEDNEPLTADERDADELAARRAEADQEPGQAPPSPDAEPKLSRAEERRLARKKAADEAKAEAEAEAAKAADTTPADAAEKTEKE